MPTRRCAPLRSSARVAKTRGELSVAWALLATSVRGGVQRLVDDPEARQQADPTLIERFHMTEEDHRVRHTDCAERLLPFEGRLPDFDLADAAQYVHENLFVPGAPGSVVKARPVHPPHLLFAPWCSCVSTFARRMQRRLLRGD